MPFFDQLVELWNSPSVDLSAEALNEKYINMTKAQVASTIAPYKQQLATQMQKALSDAAKMRAAADAGLDQVTIYGTDIIDLENNVYIVEYKNGIPTVRKKDKNPSIKTRTEGIIFDSTDNMDYENRYVSMDAHNRTNDAADVAFFRIVKANDMRTLVFPNYENYEMPGISKTKFRQFILLALSEASQERMQIVETSEDFQLLFYGKRPEVLQIQGVLKNTLDNPWNMNMLFLWDNYMRGTKLAEQGNILQLYADKELYSGYPFGFQRSKAAPNDFIVNFSFSFVVKERLSSDLVAKWETK